MEQDPDSVSYVHTENTLDEMRIWNLSSGSVTFWYWAGSSYPYLGQTDPDPALFVSDLQDGLDTVATKNYYFFAGTFWRYIYIILRR